MPVGGPTVQAIYAASALSSAILAYIIWRYRERTGARELLAAILAGWWWATALFLATVLEDPDLSVLAAKSAYVGVVVAVAAIFLFALAYTGREHLVNRRTVGLLSIEPAAVLLLVALNPGEAFFSAVEVAPATPTGIEMGLGPAFYVHALYSYVLVFAVGALILGMLNRTRALYRGQLLVLVGAVVLPLFANFVAIAGYVNFDSTPVGFVVANGLYTVAIVRYRLIDLVPIARDRVVNNVNDAMFVVDTDHRIVDVNPAGAALAREYVGDADLLGEDVRELLEFAPDLRDVYEEVVGEEDDRTIESSLDGRHLLTEATPIRDARDRTVGWLFLVRDITERKEREQTLRERNEQLDRFASVVSHDLRNPLQVAAGRVELARETGETDHLAEVEEALDRMEAIIDDVLSLARGGTEVTDMSPVSIRDAVEAAWANVDTEGATLSVATDARIVADRDRLVRLLENLLHNAVEHGMPDAAASGGPAETGVLVTEVGADIDRPQGGAGDPALAIEVGELADEPGFYVADDGAGIPPVDREAIFESGYSTIDEGTGFGLTIVSQIANAHGWEVVATESEAGGARFDIRGVTFAEG